MCFLMRAEGDPERHAGHTIGTDRMWPAWPGSEVHDLLGPVRRRPVAITLDSNRMQSPAGDHCVPNLRRNVCRRNIDGDRTGEPGIGTVSPNRVRPMTNDGHGRPTFNADRSPRDWPVTSPS